MAIDAGTPTLGKPRRKLMTAKKSNDNEFDDASEVGTDHYKVFTTQRTRTDYKVYLGEVINTPYSYRDLYSLLRNASVEDTIVFYLANHGGHFEALSQLANAVHDCVAVVQMVVDAPCYSAGAMFAVLGDNLVMKPGTFLMFHNYSTGAMGKGNALIDQVVQEDAWARAQYQRLLKDFLTDKEITALAKDQDVYVHADDKNLLSRFKRRWPHLYANKRGQS